MSYQEHRTRAATETADQIVCGVLTLSDTRTPATDTSGTAIMTELRSAGFVVGSYAIAPDEPSQIATHIRSMIADGCAVIITNGGTGIASRDSTFEAIDAMLEKRLPGFGELFRMLSYAEIGPAAMLSRATAGLVGRTVIFCLPGSTAAVRLALTKLIIPELRHLIWEVLRQARA